MTNEEYKKLLISTLKINFPDYLNKKILTRLSNDGLIINNKRTAGKMRQLTFQNLSAIDVTEIDGSTEKLVYISESDNDNFYKYIEEFEFDKSYRYSTMFTISEFCEDKVVELIEKGDAILYKKDSDTKDFVGESKLKPTIKITENGDIIVKFSYLMHCNSRNSNLDDIKYAVLCCISSDCEILEIRFDKIPQEYQYKNFYIDIVNKTIDYLCSYFGISIRNIDFKAVIDYIKDKDDNDDIIISAMEMLRNGTKALLDSRSNEDMIIPILGEIKEFIKSEATLFNKDENTKLIKQKLMYFIDEIEATSDLPSVKVFWTKTSTRVGIKHNYKDEQYSLFMYYDELMDSKEMMDDVREYFIDAYRQLEREL